MSPASSGTLQVERYIGACLISSRKSQQQQQQQQKYNYSTDLYGYAGRFRCDGWAGGMPLISFANQRCNKEDPLVRLAGAPLIQAHRYRKKKKNEENNKKGASATKSDAVSVTSDESANAENCLPRIIKPRKRRKKDRKPPPQRQDSFSTDSGSPEACYTPFAFEFRVPNESYHDALFDAPKLHHSFEEVEEARDVNGNQSTCQCRYCDPSGLIWDVDRNCYSPFLTTPSSSSVTHTATKTKKFCLIHSLSSVSLDDDGSTKSDLEVSTEIVTSPNGHRDIEIKFFSQNNKQFTDCLKSVEGCQCGV